VIRREGLFAGSKRLFAGSGSADGALFGWIRSTPYASQQIAYQGGYDPTFEPEPSYEPEEEHWQWYEEQQPEQYQASAPEQHQASARDPRP
jgi:hypothetical protein